MFLATPLLGNHVTSFPVLAISSIEINFLMYINEQNIHENLGTSKCCDHKAVFSEFEIYGSQSILENSRIQIS